MNLFQKKQINIENEKENIVYAPISGKIVQLEDVNDAVFSQKMMGDGIAIYPDGKSIYSPVSGTVSMIFPTKHAIGIVSENNVGVILHIGIETVNLKGEGFDLKIQQGQKVKAGQLLMNINLGFIAKNYDPTVIIIFDQDTVGKIDILPNVRCKVGIPILSFTKKG